MPRFLSALLGSQKLAAITLLACLCLLGAQQAVMGHAIEHPFHEQDPLCDSLIALEHNDTPLSIDQILLSRIDFSFTIIPTSQAIAYAVYAPFQARDPPR